MSEVLLTSDVVRPLGWALVHFLWQGVAIAAVAGIIFLLLRQRSANARYVGACVALLVIAGAPILTFVMLRLASSASIPSHHSLSAQAAPSLPEEQSPRQSLPKDTKRIAPTSRPLVADLDQAPPSLPATGNRILDPALPWIVLAWLVGSVVLAMRLAGGWAVAQWMRRAGTHPVAARWQRVLARLVARIRVSRPVQLLESAVAEVPTVIGWLRPVVLLPAGALAGLTPKQLEAILAHELAHIRRHDYLVNILQSAIEVVLFYHPAVWWISHRIRIEREHCCDDIAVAVSGDPLSYARALADLEQLRIPAPKPALAATGGNLLARIHRLVSPLHRAETRCSWISGVLALTVPVLLVFALVPRHVASQPAGFSTIAAPGVELTLEDELAEDARVQQIADIVSVAKTKIDELLPNNDLDQIYVEVRDASDEWWENVITDRIGAIYIGLGPKGIGELFRPDAAPVGILCRAVAELHNPERLPGLDRFLAHRYLAGAVADELGQTPIIGANLSVGSDDPTGRLAWISDPRIAAVHPDFAAAAALLDIERELGWERLLKLLDAVPIAAPNPWHAFRDVVKAQEPALEEAFGLYAEAATFEVDEDGTCLVTSFEADENVDTATTCRLATTDWLPVVNTHGCEVIFTDEWATDGDVSLRLNAPANRTTIMFRLPDPDWRYQDWSLFERFEMDIRYEGQGKGNVYAYLADDPAGGHATYHLSSGFMNSGDVRHVSVELTDETLAEGHALAGDRYYDGAFRFREVAFLQVTVAEGKHPFSLFVDNVRLTPKATTETKPRDGAGGKEAREPVAPGVADRRPPLKDRAEANELTHQAFQDHAAGRLDEAERLCREAIKLHPDFTEAHRILAWTLTDLGRISEAIDELQRVIDLTNDPEDKQEVEAAIEKLKQQ